LKAVLKLLVSLRRYGCEHEHTGISNVTSTLDSSGSTEKTKDGILDLVWVVELEVGVHNLDDVLVSMFLGHLTCDEGGWAGSGGTDEGKGEDRVLHLECLESLGLGIVAKIVDITVEMGRPIDSPGSD
jgi:hypothetical protein